MSEWLKNCPLDIPELRLYLIERGRNDRMSEYRAGRRDEFHGDRKYRVRTMDDMIVVSLDTGSDTASDASYWLNRLGSDRASLKTMVRDCDRQLELESVDEVVEQITERRKAHLKNIEEIGGRIEKYENVPAAVYSEKRIKV